ncbi:hypothetical protein F5I97DRAFT_1887332 [Phlebopus sp. FC_14]|nr:hypothetical protein F5I97DRAFT_1887332 [Phlebopus sp. FC_14]
MNSFHLLSTSVVPTSWAAAESGHTLMDQIPPKAFANNFQGTPFETIADKVICLKQNSRSFVVCSLGFRNGDISGIVEHDVDIIEFLAAQREGSSDLGGLSDVESDHKGAFRGTGQLRHEFRFAECSTTLSPLSLES